MLLVNKDLHYRHA